MKELTLNIGPIYVKAEWLRDVSSYNENYYKVESVGNSHCIHYPFNIIQEICNNAGYYEYSLGYFEKEEYGGDFIEVFFWTSVSVADSIFGNFQ